MNFNLKRSDIGTCRGCGKSSEAELFKGQFNIHGTHMYSQNGWWLRVEHSIDYFVEGNPRLPDSVGALLCKQCGEKHSERLNEIMGF